MGILVWLALGFAASCALGAYWGVALWAAPIPVLAGIFLLCFRKKALEKAAALLLGIAAGVLWFSAFQTRVLAPVYDLEDRTLETVITLRDYGEQTDYGLRARGSMVLSGREYDLMVYLDDDLTAAPGKVISGPFRFRVSAPGGSRESRFYQGEGIWLLAYQQDTLTVTEGEKSLRDLPGKLRRLLLGALEETMPQDTAAFSKALLLGDSTDLPYAVKTDFSLTGIRHIVAVSGLHVSILFSLVNLAAFRRRWLTAILGCPLLLLFAAVTGFTPSVSRACIMCGLMLLSNLLKRDYDGPGALAFAAVTLLLWNPLAIASVSYQLSFASVGGIFLFGPGIRSRIRETFAGKGAGRFRKKLVKGISLSVSVTLGATVATIPLSAWYFGTVSLLAPLSNLLVLWAVSLIFYGLAAVCALHFLAPAVAAVLGSLVAWPIRYVLAAAKLLAEFPLAAVYTQSIYICFWLVFVYVLLGVFLLSEKKRPALLGCCAALSLCAALLASWTEPLLDRERFTVLDVGQGQCLVYQHRGRTWMVDCGGSRDEAAADKAAEFLLSQGITRLDGLILTHYDRDHTGGAGLLLERIGTELLILPDTWNAESLPGEQTLYVREVVEIASGEGKIRIFPGEPQGNDNENSLCILFDGEKCDILVTGDRNGFSERQLLRQYAIPKVDVLVAGHHGSKNATCEELLAAVQPHTVCISAGKDNPFGHPAPELLERLEGCHVFRTDLHGDILIRR